MKIIGCASLAILIFIIGVFIGLFFAASAISEDDFCKTIIEQGNQGKLQDLENLKAKEQQIKEEIKSKEKELENNNVEY